MITRIPRQVLSSPATSRLQPRTLQQWSSLSNHLRQSASRQHQSCRHYTTPTPASEAPRPDDLHSQFPSATVPKPPLQPPKKRSLRRYIYATIFLLFGLGAGNVVRMVVAPPPPPLPGSREDRLMVEHLKEQAETISLVQSLSADPSWKSCGAFMKE